MEGLELAQMFGSLAAGLGAFHISRSKGLSYLKSMLSMFAAAIIFYIGAAIAIYFMNK